MKSKTMLIASLASALALPSAAWSAEQAQKGADDTGQARCYGVNRCKGIGDCSTKTHGCAGMNSCKGQAWLWMDKETCLKVEGGRLTENVEPPAKAPDDKAKDKGKKS